MSRWHRRSGRRLTRTAIRRRRGSKRPGAIRVQPIDEVCGNAVDDDCDGTVDEFSGGGEPCRMDCGDGIYSPGIYVCDVATNSLLCQPSSPDCIMPASNPPRCGDTVVDPGEQCDPADPRSVPASRARRTAGARFSCAA